MPNPDDKHEQAQRRLRDATDKLRDAETVYDEALKEHHEASQALDEMESE